MELRIKKYENVHKEQWDFFVQNESVNGTFLQTRAFLEYHGNRFLDASIMFMKGDHAIVAVIPACTVMDGAKKIYSSHSGATFGGIIISRKCMDLEHMERMIHLFGDFLKSEKYNEVSLKCTPCIFEKGNTQLLSYFLLKSGYHPYYELSSFIELSSYNEDIISNYTSGKRRDYRYSLKHGLMFQKIQAKEDVVAFYDILCENLELHHTQPVHKLEELIEFKNKRLTDIVDFYGVFYNEKMVAGSMVFHFQNDVFHTQYLAAEREYSKMYTMNFLITNLIKEAKDGGCHYFSFGISTEEKGAFLNKSLAQFKAGFGSQYGLNITYVKSIELDDGDV